MTRNKGVNPVCLNRRSDIFFMIILFDPADVKFLAMSMKLSGLGPSNVPNHSCLTYSTVSYPTDYLFSLLDRSKPKEGTVGRLESCCVET